METWQDRVWVCRLPLEDPHDGSRPGAPLCLPPGALEGCRHVDDFCECTLESASWESQGRNFLSCATVDDDNQNSCERLPVEGGILSRNFTRVLYILSG